MKSKIGDRLREIVAETKLSYRGMEQRMGLGNGTVKSWEDKTVDYSTNMIEKFLRELNINREWWITGGGEMFNKKFTETQNTAVVKEPEEIYRNLVEANSEYRLIPKSVLNEEYRLMLKSEIDERSKMLEVTLSAQNALIRELEGKIMELKSKIHIPEKV